MDNHNDPILGGISRARKASLGLHSHVETCEVKMEATPKTISVPEAGRMYFGLGRNASYAAAARRQIPTIRLGARLRVPVVAIERMLVDAGKSGGEGGQ